MLYYCIMTFNRLKETRERVLEMVDYVDKIILVDGGSIDDSIVYFRNLQENLKGKLEFYVYPWEDNFPKQRNKYLQHVPSGNWVIVSDPDERFPVETREKLRELISVDPNKEFNGYAFHARDIFLQGEKEILRVEPPDSFKPLLFYKYEDTHYDETRNPHELLVCSKGYRYKRLQDVYYEHVKQDKVIWVRGARNFFIGGGGPNLGAKNPIWIPFRELVKRKTGITDWDNFNAYLVRGNIDEEIKDWMIRHRHESGYDGASEVREMYKTYFRLYHPEEEPEELKNEIIE